MDKLIIMVDDDPFVIKSITRWFRRDVVVKLIPLQTFNFAQEVLDYLVSNMGSLASTKTKIFLFSDHNMPGMTGEELSFKVKEDRFSSLDITTVLYTGTTDAISPEVPIHYRFNKPTNPPDIMKFIADFFSNP